MTEKLLTKRRFKDGDHKPRPWVEEIFEADHSHKCPTYVNRAPPCQGSCPSGEDIRGWLNIVRGIEKPPADTAWQKYAFERVTDANPFPAIMGRVCPAPCEDGCNRNEVEDHVGINAVEQFIGDYGLEHDLKLNPPGPDSGKKVAIIGSGVAGLACAYHLRRMGHACTVFEKQEKLGGMMRYGIPGYRVPDKVLDGEIQRIIDLGVEIRNNTRIGEDISFDELRSQFDAVFIALGAQSGMALPVPGGDASETAKQRQQMWKHLPRPWTRMAMPSEDIGEPLPGLLKPPESTPGDGEADHRIDPKPHPVRGGAEQQHLP